MNKTLEVLLTVLALVGLYSAMPKTVSEAHKARVRADQVVIVADGSDPMPFCRNRHCTQ